VHCDRLNDIHDVDFSFQSHRGGRVRINIFHQRGELGLVARLIPTEIPTFEKLEMGLTVRQLMDQKRGLILVTGATGSGKSTTLAAMLDYINSTRTSHVITIEDPIEFVHNDKRSMFNQRELGLDTRSYAAALKSALRQAPDVILVGELRDAETTEVALQAAETGHLVLSTLHTNDAADSILRILGITGQDKETIVRAQLADSLRGVVSQRLIKRKDRPGRVAAQEIMVNTATIREKLLKGGHPSVVRDFIVQGAHSGMQSFDQHLIQLVNSGAVDYEEALRNATNRDDFALRFNGVSDGREAS
jgi:twitching motility protein PilT